MDRRDFLKKIGCGIAAGWTCGKFTWPTLAMAAGPELRLAFLADAHLKNSDSRRLEAQALARAVAEINALAPPPDLVILAGDLAHKGRPDALDLGREILSDLPAPLWAVRGEGDIGRIGAGPWERRFGQPFFSRPYKGTQILGLDTTLVRTSQRLAFELGSDQRTWLTNELNKLDSATPLVIISHAPLARIYLPWQQWTTDAPDLAPLLARFPRVLSIHGHGHVHSAYLNQAGIRNREMESFEGNGGSQFSLTAPYKPTKVNYFSLPATAWPGPQPVHGTPAAARPGLGPHGCGWVLATLSPVYQDFRPRLWQA